MEHADIIMSLCRTALAGGSPAVRHQVERLRDALEGDDARTASALGRILSKAGNLLEMKPSRMTRATEALGGETLTRATILPVDRETSAPLVDLVWPEDTQSGPILPPTMAKSIMSLLDEWSNVDTLRGGGVEPAMSALIYGPPGTGKTQLALWIGHQLSLPIVSARLDGLISSFLGTTSRNIGTLFAFAQRYQCILLLDEFDAVAKMRDDPQEVGEIKRVVNTLLQSLDARKKVGPTIAITNHESLLDPAIWRRFDLQIGMPMPSRDVRYELIHRYAAPLTLSESQAGLLSWCLSDVSGSEIETFLRSLKRSYLLTEDRKAFDLLAAVRNYVSLNSNRLKSQRATALLEPDERLAQTLHRDKEASHVDLCEIFKKSKSTITRWANKGDSLEAAHA